MTHKTRADRYCRNDSHAAFLPFLHYEVMQVHIKYAKKSFGNSGRGKIVNSTQCVNLKAVNIGSFS